MHAYIDLTIRCQEAWMVSDWLEKVSCGSSLIRASRSWYLIDSSKWDTLPAFLEQVDHSIWLVRASEPWYLIWMLIPIFFCNVYV